MKSGDELKSKTILTQAEACVYIGIADSAMERYRRGDDFPKPLLIMGRMYFKRSELDAWYEHYRRDGADICDIEQLKAKELLTNNEALFYTGISDTTRTRHKTRGDFPKEIRAYGNIYCRRTELDEWLLTYERGKTVRQSTKI